MADTLNSLRILRGTGNGYELDKNLTRAEGSTMIVRLMGSKNDLMVEWYEKNIRGVSKFKDVPEWAQMYVKHLEDKKLVNGISETEFGSNNPMRDYEYVTMVLRMLGYSDSEGDFVWNKSLDKAIELELITHNQKKAIEKNEEFSREEMVLISYNALFIDVKDTKKPLIQVLTEEHLYDYEMARIFSAYISDEYIEEIDKDDKIDYNSASEIFKNDSDKRSEFEGEIKKLFKELFDNYRVEYNGDTYKVALNVLSSSAFKTDSGITGLNFYVDVENMNTGEIADSSINVMLSIEGNKMYIREMADFKKSLANCVIKSKELAERNIKVDDANKHLFTGNTLRKHIDGFEDRDIAVFINEKRQSDSKLYRIIFNGAGSVVKVIDKR